MKIAFKSLKCFVFLSIFFAIAFLTISSSRADSLNATLGGDGMVTLGGFCSVECLPPNMDPPAFANVYLYMTPSGYSGVPLCTNYSGTTQVDIRNCQFNLACKNPGDYTFSAQCTGGRLVTDAQGQTTCQPSLFPVFYGTVDLPVGREILLDSPSGRVSGVQNVMGSYNFPYCADSCYDNGTHSDPCKSRVVSVSVGSTGVMSIGV